ncbi:response regulator [Flavobacterium sp. Sd200]|uniref:ATP-binding protein n=1 Tax=Flavobacterium sp. Sd200 TaxID=2692211 RepID=UPI0013713854|nr:ATP-binding protein [Flavobacterium sp. Sd200]MXN90986.1 response regulator [Flavobacterium sp. Sd200]
MVQKPKATKYKVVAGYFLLFITAVLSVWFVYTEILKIARPAQNAADNNKIIRISNTIASLYASEAIGRSSILTGNAADLKNYNRITDSINTEIEAIKSIVEPAQAQKFDTVQMLLSRKKASIAEIIKYRKNYSADNTFTKAISGIHITKDSIWENIKPVKFTKSHEWRKVVNSLLTPRQLDSLSKLPVSNDSLAMAFEKVLTNLLIKDNKLRYQLYRKEQKMLEENRIISDKLRVILASVEHEFVQKSYKNINQSQAALAKTINTMAWVGAVTLFFLIVFAYIIINDLTTQQNYRRQLEILNTENEELLRTKSMLMATVTHDLQTPLGSIIGFHDLIKKLGVTPRQSHYLANIKESANYILKLVNDLLDFSRLENNRITIEQQPFNFKVAIETACRSLQPMAFDKDIELNWDIEDELDAYFISDPYRIKQVLTNLVSNALKFTHEGSVEITAKIEDKNIILSVIDTGIGIAKQNHSAIFKEFTQAHTGIEKKFGGTGLGLTISKKIIELLGGTISLESQEGQGSIFTITLPCIPATDHDIEQPLQERHNIYDLLRGKKILITDDDNVQLMLMKELLGHYPVEVTTEINSATVINHLQNNNFDILLTDVQMPVVDGFELVRQIRQHSNPNIAALPVIALSGKQDLAVDDYKERGFTAHHTKPVQLEDLLELIAGIFDRSYVKNESTTPNPDKKSSTGQLYSLNSLSQFTYNDPEALKEILDTFIESANDNCAALLQAAQQNDIEATARTAHKMIPMLRQMEVYSIVQKLVPLEEKTLVFTQQELITYIEDVCSNVNVLCSKLQEEITV